MEMNKSRLQLQAHFQWLDFLRGLSALSIILFHVRVDLWVGWEAIRGAPASYSAFDRMTALLSIPTPFFGSAVMLFFLVSGFCIHYPYATGRALELKRYGIRRGLRIYPPYLLAVLLGLLIEKVLKTWLHAPRSASVTLALSALMLQNVSSHTGQMISNPSLWSLPVEAELYLVYPFFYWAARHWGWKNALATVTVVSLFALGLSFRFSGVIIVHFAAYWIIWCAGAMLAQGAAQEKLPRWNDKYGTVTLITLLGYIIGHLLKWPALIQDFAAAGFYFMVMLWGLTHSDPLGRLGKPLRQGIIYIGTISYSLYLIHFPVFKICGAFWVARFGVKPANFLIPLTFALLVIPAAALFHFIIEAPSHLAARKFGQQNQSAQLAFETPRPAENASAPIEIAVTVNDSAAL